MSRITKSNIYKNKGGASYHQSVHDVSKIQYSWISRERAKKIQPFINKSDILLEYGSGIGFNLRNITAKNIYAYDVSKYVDIFYEKTNIFFTTKINDLPKKRFTKIISHHVLEHVSNPQQTLIDMRRLLISDGSLLLYLPYEKTNKFNKKDRDFHLYSWTPQTIFNLLKSAGFIDINISIGSFGYDIFASRIAEKFNLGFIGYLFIKRFCSLLRPVSELRIIAR